GLWGAAPAPAGQPRRPPPPRHEAAVHEADVGALQPCPGEGPSGLVEQGLHPAIAAWLIRRLVAGADDAAVAPRDQEQVPPVAAAAQRLAVDEPAPEHEVQRAEQARRRLREPARGEEPVAPGSGGVQDDPAADLQGRAALPVERVRPIDAAPAPTQAG